MRINKCPTITRIDSDVDLVETLPPILRNRILLCAHERKVPPEIPMMIALAAIATCAGSGVEIMSGRDRTTRANLFVLLGVSSGIGKSEVFRDLLGPVMKFENELHAWWPDEPSAKARAGEELLKARITGLRATFRKSPNSGSMEIFRLLQQAERTRAVCRSYLEAPCILADDSTSEALAVLMGRSNESIATVSADARYSLKRLGVPNSKEESFYLKGFSGDLTLTNRVSRNSVRLRRPCLTTLLLTQRDAYGNFIEKALINRSGLLPRFLHADFPYDLGSTTKVDLRSAPKFRTEYQTLIQQLIEAYRFEKNPVSIETTPSALKFIQRIEADCRTASLGDESVAIEVLRRRAEQIWRVSLCLHLARYGNTAAIHPLVKEDAVTAVKIVERFTFLTSN